MTVGMYDLDIFVCVLYRFLLYLYWRAIDSHPVFSFFFFLFFSSN